MHIKEQFIQSCAGWLCTFLASRKQCVTKNFFFHLSIKTYVVGAQKNRLNETFLLSNQNTPLNWWIRMDKKIITILCFLSLPASHWLITFANILVPDQDRQNVSPDLDPNCLTLWSYSWKIFSQKVDFFKKSADDKNSWKITQHAKS